MPLQLLFCTTKSLLTSHFPPDEHEPESVRAFFPCLFGTCAQNFSLSKISKTGLSMFALANGTVIFQAEK